MDLDRGARQYGLHVKNTDIFSKASRFLATRITLGVMQSGRY